MVPRVVRVEEEFENALSPVQELELERSVEEAAKTEMLEEPLNGTPLMVRIFERTVAAVEVPRI